MILSDVASWNRTRSHGPLTVVIGAGAVGLYAASELAKRGRRVVVIESGSVHLDGFAPESFESVGRPHDGIEVARSRALGGTTNLWGGQLVEFQPADFDGRDWLPGSRWPVRYEEIAPFYRATYENFGLTGPVQDDDAVWESVSLSRPRLGDRFEAFLTRWLRVPNFAVLFEKQYAESPLFSVLTEHTAVGFEGAGEGISGVRVVDRSGARSTVRGDVFILAAGTVENSRLLLHGAADRSWPCPWRANANVGRYFQDHLGGKVATVRPNDPRRFFDTFCTIVRGGQKYQPKFRMRNEMLARERILNIQGIFSFDSSVSENLVYLKQFVKAALYSRKVTDLAGFAKALLACRRYVLPLMWRYVWDHRIFVPSTSKISLLIQAEQAPLAESRIRLHPTSVDAFGLPRVVLDWRLAGIEQASIREFALRAEEALRGEGLAALEIDEDLSSMNPRFMDSLRDTFHQAGGAVMGWSERDGVVDSNLRVFGTTNLYVAGASTFRTASNANTTFTAIAFTTRLIYHLCGEPSPDRLSPSR